MKEYKVRRNVYLEKIVLEFLRDNPNSISQTIYEGVGMHINWHDYYFSRKRVVAVLIRLKRMGLIDYTPKKIHNSKVWFLKEGDK